MNLQGTNGEGKFCFWEIVDSHNTRLAYVVVSSSFFRLIVYFDFLGVDFTSIQLLCFNQVLLQALFTYNLKTKIQVKGEGKK